MFAYLLVIICAATLLTVSQGISSRRGIRSPLVLLAIAFAVRLVIQSFLADINVFSTNGVGLRGDSTLYEMHGILIARLWEQFGVHWVEPSLIPQFEATKLPGYLFASIIYLNGAPTLLGCVSVIAMLGCLTCYNLYLLAIELGADETVAFRILVFALFSPGFLLYTSDTAKDGIVAFLAITALAAGFRLTRKVSAVHIILGAFALWGLWFTRFYLVYLSVIPLLVGLLFGKTSYLRRLMVGTVGIGALAAFAAYSTVVSDVSSAMEQTFEVATAANVLQDNASSGSGVLFDDGGNKWGALHLKVLYTLFSPFPWASGSVGLQIGKLDTVVWYYLFYRAARSLWSLWRIDLPLFLSFLSFQLPVTIAYATTMSNVGLIYRQRIPLVLFTYALAALSWSHRLSGDAADSHSKE